MSLAKQDGQIWFDGELVAWQDATIHVLSHSLHYGTGVFEGVRCYQTINGPAIFRLNDHTDRLFRSAHIIGIDIPFSRDDLNRAQCKVIAANQLTSGYIRPIVFYGAHALGISATTNPIHVAVSAWSWGTYLGEKALERGIRIKTSSFTRLHVNANMCQAKVCGHYINSVLANAEVTRHGYDEALLLDNQGLVAEGAGENIFVIRRRVIYTPELTSVLEGITRETIITLAKDQGYEVLQQRLTRDMLYCADEIFLTGTAAEITPVREVDDRQIGEGKRGEITTALQNAFFDAVYGRSQRWSHWLTAV